MWQKLSFLFESKYEMDSVDGQALFKLGCIFQTSMIDFLADYTIPTCKSSDNETNKNVHVSIETRESKSVPIF